MKTTNYEKTNPDIEKSVKLLLRKLITAQETGDINAFSECFTHNNNAVHIGTDQDEIWYNWQDFFNLMKIQLEQHKGSTINHKNTTVHHNSTGDVAWYSQLIDRCPQTNGDDVCIEGFRHTGVMEKKDDKWMIVQSHISFPKVYED